VTKPPHPGIKLLTMIKATGLPLGVFAAHIRLSRIMLHNITTGKARITPATALRLERALGLPSAYDWLRKQAEYDLYVERRRMQAKLADINYIDLGLNQDAVAKSS
jgi:addiction module HigA family antidote